MMAQSDLTPKQTRFVGALIAGHGVSQAAEQSSVSRRTAYRWLEQQAVQLELRRRGSAVLVGCEARFSTLLDLALDRIEAGLGGRSLTISQRWAAGAVLRHCQGLLEYLDLQRRVTELERQRRIE